MNSLEVPKGASLAVFGTGAVGLAAVMAARLVGAHPIIGVDLNPMRLELARELGATHTIDNRHEDVVSRINDITGSGVDYVLEITGAPRMHQFALTFLSPRARWRSLLTRVAPALCREGVKSAALSRATPYLSPLSLK